MAPTNREHLKQLLSFLRNEIIHEPQNKWFVDELFNNLSPLCEGLLSDVHEQCIESVLLSQAKDFYKDFVLKEIKDQLINDFVKMEHWRRRDNIQEFCMALYQQIEAIVNHLSSLSQISETWSKIKNEDFNVRFKTTETKKSILNRFTGDKKIKHKIIREDKNLDAELSTLPAMDKFKAILFMVVYKTDIDPNNMSFFMSDFLQGYDIYRMRNLNHRGNVRMGGKTDEIAKDATLNMAQMVGFLAKFVVGINQGYPLNEDILKLAERNA